LKIFMCTLKTETKEALLLILI